MRYAFVCVSIFSIWLAVVMLAVWTPVDSLFLLSTALLVTVILFTIGFRKSSH